MQERLLAAIRTQGVFLQGTLVLMDYLGLEQAAWYSVRVRGNSPGRFPYEEVGDYATK